VEGSRRLSRATLFYFTDNLVTYYIVQDTGFHFKKALYELPEDQVMAENIQSLADEIERTIQGGFSPRPTLSVPHIVSDEASCYYQGYTVR
jgi:hypothetical protein